MFRNLLAQRWFFYANIILLFFLINGVFDKAACRLDLSRDQINSVSASTERVFTRLSDPVLIEAYISKDVTGEISSGLRPLISTLEEMQRIANDKLKLRVYNPNTEELRSKAQERGIRGIPISQQKEIEASVRLGYFGLYLQQGEESTTIMLLDRNWFVQDLEYRILRSIRKFSNKGTQSGIGILKTEGTAETTAWTKAQDQNKDNNYGFKSTLEREQGTVQEVELDKAIPGDVQTLIVIGLPKLSSSDADSSTPPATVSLKDLPKAYYLDQFLLRGGNMICLLKGFDFQMQTPDPRMRRMGMAGGASLGVAQAFTNELNEFNTWLGRYGITLSGDILLEPRQAMPVWDFLGQFPLQILYPAWAIYTRDANNINSNHPALEPIDQIIFPWFSSLDVKEVAQAALNYDVLVSSSTSAIRLPSTSLGYREIQNIAQTNRNYLGYSAPLAVLASGKFKSAFAPNEIPKGTGIDRKLHISQQPGFTEAAEARKASKLKQAGSKPNNNKSQKNLQENSHKQGIVPPQKITTKETESIIENKTNLAVISTPYLVSDILLKNPTGANVFQLNSGFIMNLLETMQGDTDLLDARSRKRTISLLIVKSKFLKSLISWSFSLGLPLLLGIWGAVRLARRNHKRGI